MPVQVPLLQDVDNILANRYRLREQIGRGGMADRLPELGELPHGYLPARLPGLDED